MRRAPSRTTGASRSLSSLGASRSLSSLGSGLPPSRKLLPLLIAGCLAAAAAGSDLIDAVERDDPAGIRAALADGDELDEPHGGGQTALMAACLKGKAQAVRALLEAGADRTKGEGQGYTCAHGVGFQGRAELVPILAEFKFDLSDRHSDGFTPLHRACWGKTKGHTATVRALLEAGVPPDEQTGDGKLPAEITPSKHTQRVLEAAMGPETMRTAQLAKLQEVAAAAAAEHMAKEAAAKAAGAKRPGGQGEGKGEL